MKQLAVTLLCVGDSHCETEHLCSAVFFFSPSLFQNPEKFMLLCLLTNAEQDEKACEMSLF